MEMFDNLFKLPVVQRATNVTDYRNGDGLLMCGRCHKKKEMKISIPENNLYTYVKHVAIMCDCMIKEYEYELEQTRYNEFRIKLEALQRDGITDKAYLKNIFIKDDKRNIEATNTCQKYVEKWDKIKAENIGILFTGGIGTGKTFLAGCIANALLENLVPVSITSFPRIINIIQDSKNEKQAIIDKLQKYDLLIIDDLGVERDTTYAAEQVYNVVDARFRSGKPLIITTNLTIGDLKKAPTLIQGRIYDRIIEMCPIKITLKGESRREHNASEKRQKARQIMEL